MTPLSLRRKALLLLLAAFLALPWPSAAAPRQAPNATTLAPSTLWNHAWSFLQSLWSEAGCIIDPGGRCAAGASKPTTDTGCGIDPGGRCITGGAQVTPPSPPQTNLDEGCGIDPGGRCHG
jgi:hypothetical protein